MDTGKGYLVAGTREELEAQRRDLVREQHDRFRNAVEEAGREHHIWEVGEEVTIRGMRLRVKTVGSRFIRFQVLPWKVEESTV